MMYRIPILILGLIVSAYWGRVLRMARKARQKTGRAANFLPPEPVGRMLRILWVPVVLVWVTHPFVTALSSGSIRLLRPFIASPWVAWPAVALVAVCFQASRVCWRTMGKNWRMGIDPSERTALVVGGAFAYVRHPIYALSQAMMLASVIDIPSPLMIAAGLSHVLLLQWEARREEGHLRLVHGEEYRRYCAQVSRFFPLPWKSGVPESPLDRPA
jgi:protein-S-isoprenylcysteine O-methyltransferase Ste14